MQTHKFMQIKNRKIVTSYKANNPAVNFYCKCSIHTFMHEHAVVSNSFDITVNYINDHFIFLQLRQIIKKDIVLVRVGR